MKKTYNKKEQYETLSKRFSLTKEESDLYYNAVRKARKKAQDMKRRGSNALHIPLYSLRIDSIQTRDNFENRFENITHFLSKDFTKSSNREIRENYYKQIENYYSEYKYEAQLIIAKLKEMSDKEFKDFFERADINLYIFYEQDFETYYDMLGMSIDKYLSMLELL